MTDFVFGVWIAFWVYWLSAAIRAKESVRRRGLSAPRVLAILAFVLLRVFGTETGSLAAHDLAVQVLGVVLLLSGLAFAVWARLHLGRNWGMPMSRRREPELVTSGPYRFVRHPIYSGLLLAFLGTGLAINLEWLIALGVLGAYFIFSATVEERVMSVTFPDTYASYRARTKMLIPFVL
jgi:protein-S-isoprenylcysteine O-methyltransferase Ste14